MFGVFAAESDQDGMFSFRSLYEAYLACRKRKRNTVNALKFEVDLLENLRTLSETMTDGSYRPSRSVCFVTCSPKLREIFAADFRDRVVHHLLVPRLEAIYEPKFIHDSYACRLNKGTHAAVRRLQSFMNTVSRSGRRPAWFMQLDIRSFFMSIDRDRLLAMIERHITDADLLALARVIIKSDCTEEYAYKGAPGLLEQIPPHKSLFQVQAGKGLPIGNLTSQFFANVYLNELDQFVKHTLKCRHYLRYVDDFILLHESKEALAAMEAEIEAFLDARLQLQVKQDFCLKRVSEGADFLGYIVRPDYILVRQRVLGNLRGKLATFKAKIMVEGAVGRRRYVQLHLRPETVTALRQNMASYLGHFVHADSRRLVDGLWEKHAWFTDIFTLRKDGRLQPEYEPQQQPRTMRRQYQWAWQRFGRRAALRKGEEPAPVEGERPWVCIFFQVGRFIEFFGRQAQMACRVFGLALRKGRWLGVPQCGFPVRMLRTFKDKARHLGLSYVVIAEQGCSAAGLKRRVVTEKLTFVEG